MPKVVTSSIAQVLSVSTGGRAGKSAASQLATRIAVKPKPTRVRMWWKWTSWVFFSTSAVAWAM